MSETKDSNVINVSFQRNDKEQKLKKYIKSKISYSTWIKEACFEKMDRELNQSNNNFGSAIIFQEPDL